MSVYERILENQEHLKLLCPQEQLTAFASSCQADNQRLEFLASYLDMVVSNKKERSIEMLQKCSKIPVMSTPLEIGT